MSAKENWKRSSARVARSARRIYAVLIECVNIFGLQACRKADRASAKPISLIGERHVPRPARAEAGPSGLEINVKGR